MGQYEVNTGTTEENTGQFTPIPEGTYEGMITEVSDKTTSKGDPMGNIKIEIQSREHKGKWVYDNIVIPLEGSPSFKIMGRTMHFLHCIGEEYKGKFIANTENWLWKKLKIQIKHEMQKEGKYAGSLMARISSYDFADETKKDDSDILF